MSTLVAAGRADAADPVRLMVVGDSISQGSSGDYTWRYRLAKHLTAASVGYDLVGPRNDLFDRASNAHGSNRYVDPVFDSQHAAKWGEMLGFAADRIAADVTGSGAQILLTHLGINDLVFGGTVAGTEEALRRYIANARTANPNVRMFFSKVLVNEYARDNADAAAKVAGYNDRLTAVAAALSTSASPIHVLGTPAGYDPAADTYDGTHLNPRGEFRLAALYADGLAAHAGIGRPFGAIPSVPLFGAPATLTAQPGDTAVRLTWSEVVGATGYHVWVRDVTIGEAWRQLPYPLNVTTWDAELLTNGHTWEFRIEALRGRDRGGFSPVASATPSGPPPAAVTDLRAEPLDGGALLSWSLVDRAGGYIVYMRDVTSGQEWQRLPYPVEGPQWTAGLMLNGRTYEFKLRTSNINGESGFSNTVSVVPRGSRPDAPENLRATPGDTQATLTWTASAGSTGYIVYVRDVTAGQAWQRLPYPVQAPSWTAGLLVNGHVYEFKLRAISGDGESDDSAVVRVTPAGAKPSAPSNLAASPGDGQATLSWSPADGATAYYVYMRDVTAGETSFTRLPYGVPGPSWTAGLLVNTHTYEFKLKAANANGESAFSNTASVVPIGPKPNTPTNLTATAGNGQATLCWKQSSGANHYMVYMRDVTAGEPSFTRLPYGVPGPCWTAGLLANQHVYEFKLRAANLNGESGFSNTASVRPVGPTPAAPTGLTATSGESEAMLCWNLSSGANHYMVYVRDVTAGESFTRLPYGVPGPCWTAGLLVNGHVYEFKLRAVNINGESGFSATINAYPKVRTPGAPSGLLALPRLGSVFLKWHAASLATNYHIYMRNQSNGWRWTLIRWDVTGTTWTHNGAGWEWHEYRVVAARYGTEGGVNTSTDVRPLYDVYDGGWVGYYPGGECTAYAAAQVQWRTGLYLWLMPGTTMFLNAETWDEAARAQGWAVDRNARRFDVAHWEEGEALGDGGNAGSPGHVGYVAHAYTDWDGTRRIVIDDYNRASHHGYGWMDIALSAMGGRFIHIQN